MALNYNALFLILGRYIDHTSIWANTFDFPSGYISDLATDLTEIETAFDTAGVELVLDDLVDLYRSMQDDITNWVTGALKTQTDNVLLDQTLVLDEISLVTTPTVRAVLEELYRSMIADNQSIAEQTVDIAAINAGTTITTENSNALAFAVSNVLDGSSSPVVGIAPFSEWNGTTSCLSVIGQRLILRCTADSESGNTVRGGEQFQARCGVPNPPFGRLPEGAGTTNVTAANNLSITPAGKFDSWDDSGNPLGWTLVAKDAALSLFESASGVRGTHCLAITPTEKFTIRLPVSANLLTRRKTFMLWCVAKRLGAVSGSPDVTISLNDDTGMIGSAVSIVSGLGTTWTLFSGAVTIPNSLAGTPYIEFKVTAPFGGTSVVLVDDVSLTPAVFFNGLNILPVVLDGKVIVGDEISTDDPLDNSDTGYFTRYFRAQYQFQFPTTDGPPSIDDSGAT